jgi:hypothetical protein
MVDINYDNCLSVMSKKNLIQCNKKRKNGSLFCGIHIKVNENNLVRFDKINLITNKDINIVNDNSYNLLKFDDLQFELNRFIDIIYSIKTYNIPINSDRDIKLDINKRYYFDILYNFLRDNPDITICDSIKNTDLYINTYENCEDIFSLEDIKNIPNIFIYIYISESNKRFAFDIRYLNKHLKLNSKINPFTNTNFSDDDINNINKYINNLKKLKISIELEEDQEDFYDEASKLKFKVIKVFQAFDFLDNYTNINWFLDLELNDLKKLLYECYDIWNYRASLSNVQKFKILSDGKAFENYLQITMTNNKYKIQNYILDEFYRFTVEGIDINERKLGVMLMLVGLVIVSPIAAEALPHLAHAVF